IQLIDEQHKDLVNFTNDLYESCLAGDKAARKHFHITIHKTVNYIKNHFATEERIMEKIKYPGLMEHKREHESFVKQVFDDVKNYESGKKYVPNVFVRFLKDWILTHVALVDKKYADYILTLKKQSLLQTK
ncbi:MAG: bacteriohemerythrin, partial [Treponema sp.]|nr:bacteriohemerythrin [Treponema sp.]